MIPGEIRVGVLSAHRGNRRQLRLMRALEDNGWCSIVFDTTDNVSSANSVVRASYRRLNRSGRGPGAHAYWRKVIK